MNNGKALKAAQASILAQVDAAIADAQVNPAAQRYTDAQKRSLELSARLRALRRYDYANRAELRKELEDAEREACAADREVGYVMLTAAGVGRYKVRALPERLRDFRRKIAACSGFTYRRPTVRKPGWLPEGRRLPAQGPLVPDDFATGTHVNVAWISDAATAAREVAFVELQRQISREIAAADPVPAVAAQAA